MHAIFVTGLARSGTTWISQALAAATKSHLVHEPFNWRLHGDQDRRRYRMKYLPQERDDPGFTAILQAAIDGADRRGPGRRDWRVVVKDVHCCLAIESVHRELQPLTVIVVRHPCGVAESWRRLAYDAGPGLASLLDQNELMEAHLDGFQAHMRVSDDYFFRIGAYWGAVYHTLGRLASSHPEWRWLSHEAVCREPTTQLERLLGASGWRMAYGGRRFLKRHDRSDGHEAPYSIDRVALNEPDKWRDRLTSEQASRVIAGAQPFAVLERLYPDA